MITRGTAYIDDKRLYMISEIGINEPLGYINLVFVDRGYIPRISRFKYHEVQLIYCSNGTIKASGKIITKGLKRRKNTLYLKISDMFMEKRNEM